MKEMVKNDTKWKWLALMFAISTGVFFVLTVTVWVIKDQTPCSVRMERCRVNSQLDFSELDDYRKDVMTSLSHEEVAAVIEYLDNHPEFNLQRPKKARIDTSFIHLIELQTPKKSDVLRYLDANGTKPTREAKVYIMHGDNSPPFIGEYIVGPLMNISYVRMVNTTARQSKIPYIYRPFSSFEFMAIYKYVIGPVGRDAREILLESYNATPTNCGERCLRFSMTPISSGYLEEGLRKAWFWFAYDVEFYTLHPLDFQFLVDMTSADPKNWKIQDVFYANQLFDSLDSFLSNYTCVDINKTRLSFPEGEDKSFGSLEFRNPPVPDKPARPPHQYEPDGQRFKVRGNAIQYMSWRFQYKMSAVSGLQLFDITYNKERIIYEMSMQEVTVLYSGYSPTARMLYYADGAGLFGTRCRGLVPSVDCPSNAKFIDTFLYSANEGGYRIYENAVCIFEHNTNIPLRRHRAYGRSGAFYGGLVGTVLTVRSIMSVINYDYIFDFMFYQTGAVEIRVSLTGYLSTSFYFPQESKYGSRLNDNLLAGLHNHLFHFKIDLDVLGTNNYFETLNIEMENETNPWDHKPHVQNNYHRQTIETEVEATYKYNFSTPRYLLISNKKRRTSQKTPRSYRIKPSGMSKLLLPDDYGFARSISWARYQMAVTKHKDWEESSSSIFTMWDARDPVVNFQNYIADNENITDEDLVAWVTLGTQHIPQTENIPNSLTLGSQLSLFLLPFNYFDEDESMKSRDSVRITPKSKENPTSGAFVERHHDYTSSCHPVPALPDEILGYNSTTIFT